LVISLAFLLIFAKWALGFILFPFSTFLMNYRYHFLMNQKMIFELKSTFEEANYFIQNNMSRDEYFKFHSFKEYKSQSYQIKKLCDYAQLFASVNREIIDDHQDKNSRGKQTRRW
jgi:hypothetical protein